jgi:hypothetical protein
MFAEEAFVSLRNIDTMATRLASPQDHNYQKPTIYIIKLTSPRPRSGTISLKSPRGFIL